MSVLIETTAGNLVVDLSVKQSPVALYNFLKLCRLKYYFFSPFFHSNVPKVLGCGLPQYPQLLQYSINKYVDISCFSDISQGDSIPRDKCSGSADPSVGLVGFDVSDGIRSQFSILLEPVETDLVYFGKVSEGFSTLLHISKSTEQVRIVATHVLEDPFPDPPQLSALIPKSQVPTESQIAHLNMPSLEVNTNAQALALELMGDLPRYNVKPAANVLFVTHLNPITSSESLETIFSRFGPLKATVVRDKQGKSKRYGFLEFESVSTAEQAYSKLQEGCIIDGNEVLIDFSQSTRKSYN